MVDRPDHIENESYRWVWPLFGLKASWTGSRYDMGLGLHVYRVAEEVRDQLNDEILKNTPGMETDADIAFLLMTGIRRDWEWALCVDLGGRIQDAPHLLRNLNIKFEAQVVQAFLAAARLVHSVSIVAPLSFEGQLDCGENQICGFTHRFRQSGELSGPPRTEERRASTLTESDLQQLSEVWQRVYEVLRLHSLAQVLCDEAWMHDKQAEATKRRDKLAKAVWKYLMSEESRAEYPSGVKEYIQECRRADEDAGYQEHQDWLQEFDEVLRQAWHKASTPDSRLGRAIALFNDGQLSFNEDHAFLASFFALETLFNTASTEGVARTISLRVAQLLWRWGRRQAEPYITILGAEADVPDKVMRLRSSLGIEGVEQLRCDSKKDLGRATFFL